MVDLRTLTDTNPLIQSDETIAIFGANGQIGVQLRPYLEALYPGRIRYADVHAEETRQVLALNVTDHEAVMQFINTHRARIVINLAAFLSAKAAEMPALANEINNEFPQWLMENGQRLGLRTLLIPSSMAVIECDKFAHPEAVRTLAPQEIDWSANSPNWPTEPYAQNKFHLEANAEKYRQTGFNIIIPRLAGVTNMFRPWPSPGTTEEAVDKFAVAAAYQAAYGDAWVSVLTDQLWKTKPANVAKELVDDIHSHIAPDGTYIVQVPQDSAFCMIDGKTLPETLLLLLHTDINKGKGHGGAVHNVSEYTISMQQMAHFVKELNPDFKFRFASRDELAANPAWAGKMRRADMWPHDLDTSSTKVLIGEFQHYIAEQSIRERYDETVHALLLQQLDTMPNKPDGMLR